MKDNVRNLARFGHTLVISATFLANEPQQVHYTGKIYYRKNEDSAATWVGDVESSVSREDLVSKAEEKCRAKKTPVTSQSWLS